MGELTQEAEQAAINLSRDMGRSGVKAAAFLVRIVFNFAGGIKDQTRDTIALGIEKRSLEARKNNPYWPDRIPKNQAKIDIDTIRKQGNMKRIDEDMSKELMAYFDKYCKVANVKYAIMETKDKDKDSRYSIFFNAPEASSIDWALKQGIKDYENEKIDKKREKERIAGIEEKIGKTFKDGLNIKNDKGIHHLTNKELEGIAIREKLDPGDKNFVIRLKREAAKSMGSKSKKNRKRERTKGFLDSFNGSLIEALTRKNKKSVKDNESRAHEKIKRKNEQTR